MAFDVTLDGSSQENATTLSGNMADFAAFSKKFSHLFRQASTPER
jgi:hypothetical protein